MKEASIRDIKMLNKNSLNEEKVFELVFKAYFPRLKAFSLKFVSKVEVAEDIIQEVFVKLWENKDTIRDETFHSYLFTMVRNACLNYLKHEKIVNNHLQKTEDSGKEEALYYADFFSDPHHQTIYNELVQEINRLKETLPQQTQVIFELSRFKGLNNNEIAEQLGITTRTVEKHITRALHIFKVHFAQNYIWVLIIIEWMYQSKTF